MGIFSFPVEGCTPIYYNKTEAAVQMWTILEAQRVILLLKVFWPTWRKVGGDVRKKLGSNCTDLNYGLYKIKTFHLSECELDSK